MVGMARRGIALTAMATLALLASGLTGCGAGSADSSGGGKVELALVAYSTPQAAYTKIIKTFQATPEGKNVTFTQSYGASGDQSRAVASGLKADIVAFSLAPDIDRLTKAGLVAADWNTDAAGPSHGFVTDSVVAIGARKGNPKGIKTWADLTKPGVQVITPNPFTSGGARWNILAGYGAVSAKGTNKTAGVAFLNSLLKNVPVQDNSGRASLQTFIGGNGDAIPTYDNDAIFAQQKGQALDYTVPDSTILIENPVAVTKNSAHPVQAKAFLAFLYSATVQKIFVDSGYRPTTTGVPGADKFPTPPGLFTIKDLGGWTQVTKDFFDPQAGVITGIEKKLGVSTGKS